MEPTRAHKIAETLEQLVFSGAYKDGDRLDEVTLAEQFCVSRTPIREALQVLVSSGVARQIPRRGVFVRQPGPVELMEMFETMAELAKLPRVRIDGADRAIVLQVPPDQAIVVAARDDGVSRQAHAGGVAAMIGVFARGRIRLAGVEFEHLVHAPKVHDHGPFHARRGGAVTQILAA